MKKRSAQRPKPIETSVGMVVSLALGDGSKHSQINSNTVTLVQQKLFGNSH